MNNNKLEIAQLDFDTIKNNLKNFLRSQKEFQDYDFDGSGLSILLDVLAYNTHYNAYYLNMVANESFLDTAILRDSVVSHAKTLGYVPYSRKASKAVINFVVPDSVTENTSITLSRGFSFKSQLVDSQSYNFTVLEDVEVTKTGDAFYFNNLEIYEGTIVTNSFTQNQENNPKSVFTLPDRNIDTSTIKVTVQESLSNTFTENFNLVRDVTDITDESPIFFLQEFRNQFYQIYFGDDVIGKKLKNGSIVTVSYLATSGQEANKISRFVPMSQYGEGVIELVSQSSGGAERESVDEIKFNSVNQFSIQNRLVTVKDYETYIKQNFPIIDSLSVWGGEEEVPPVFGKIFISLKPKDNYYLTENEKRTIVDKFIKPKAIVSVQTEIRDPEYLYLRISNRVKYNKKKTFVSQDNLKNIIREAILAYRDDNLDTFNSVFIVSKMQEYIGKVDKESILGSETRIRLEKRFKPVLNQSTSYKLDFKTSLVRGSLLNRLISTEFKIFDNIGVLRTAQLEEIPESSTGISKIILTNAGYNYTREPKVTITGDGEGALAKAIVVNGKVQSIEITNRGINYTRAMVKIEGGNGYGAQGTALLDSRFGVLRTVYFLEDKQRQIINSNAGTIDYDTGEININNLKVIVLDSSDGFIRLNVESLEGIIESERNSIITIDEYDTGSIDIQLVE